MEPCKCALTLSLHNLNFKTDFSSDYSELEIKLTGILNLYTLAEGEKSGAFGTEVAPRVVAHHHQRKFFISIAYRVASTFFF